MTSIKITNGFHDIATTNIILSGTLLEGVVRVGDMLIIDDNTKTPILSVEIDIKTLPNVKILRLTVSNTRGIVWHKLYGRQLTVEANV